MRVSSKPINIPDTVTWTNKEGVLSFKTNKGELVHHMHSSVQLVDVDGKIHFAPIEGQPNAKALAGTTRALVSNIITGLTDGFEKKLELKGVGYRAKVEGKVLVLNLGKSHQDKFEAPAGISLSTPSQTEIVVSGICKQLVCQVAANIRAFRKPEPYKGKGIRYAGEKIIIKEVNK
jgi:large subunit ribosomal protein L6